MPTFAPEARLANLSPTRGIDCDLVPRSGGIENMGDALPYLDANASDFFNDDFAARLVTEDGLDPVLPNADGGAGATRVEFQGRFEAGRPAGLAPGSELDAPFAVNIAGLPLAPGRYEWQVEIDQNVVGRVPFTVMES